MKLKSIDIISLIDTHNSNNTKPILVFSVTYTICKGPKLDASRS